MMSVNLVFHSSAAPENVSSYFRTVVYPNLPRPIVILLLSYFRTLVYPGNAHPIDKVDSEADAFVNIVQWFVQHLQ